MWRVSSLGCVFFSTALALLAGPSGAAPADAAEAAPWPVPTEGWTPPEPGEHPRLFFRKADLPKIKERAATAEGKAIVARLRELLGGGEEMPSLFNTSTGAYQGNIKDAPVGTTYTLWHGAGFGMLYQLTGDRKYADLGRACVQKALDGVRDRDDRYAWTKPGGALRAGPSLGAIAMAYDLNYDGWDADFREAVARAIQDYDQGPNMSLASLARGTGRTPTTGARRSAVPRWPCWRSAETPGWTTPSSGRCWTTT